MKIRLPLLFAVSISLLWAADFWVDRDFTTWSRKECEALLAKSPWVFANSLGQVNLQMGETQRERVVTFRFRLLSAKPIRMAFAQLRLLGKPGDSAFAEQMKQMVETPPDRDNRILIQLDFSVTPAGDPSVRDIHSFLLNSHFVDFRDSTSLSSSGKDFVTLLDYWPPTPKQPNAVFVFPRLNDKGEPYFDGSEKWIALKTDIQSYKVYARNPVEKMKFRGVFEF